MELLDVQRSVVLVVDLQETLMGRIHRPQLVVDATIRLLKLAGIFDVPVLLSEQYPEGLGGTDPGVRAAFDALETPTDYLKKISFGCCGDASFERKLAALLPDVPRDRRQVVIAGIEAHICVMQTTLELLREGSQVHLCWECVSGRGEEYRRHALDRMRQAGAQITNHESVAFEWARDKDHEAFHAMNRLLREGQLT